MSVATKNLFAVLDDENSEDVAFVEPVTKKNTSSKKADQPPPKANPAKANPNRKAPTGNEGAFKNKDVGRSVNRAKPTEDASSGSKSSKSAKGPAKFDRHSNRPRDSEKQVNKAWGSEKTQKDDEVAAEAIAHYDEESAAIEDASVAAEESEPENTKTLEEYFAELEVKNAGLSTRKSQQKSLSTEVDDKWANAQPLENPLVDLIPAKPKKIKQKARKEKNVLVTDFTFTSSSSPSSGSRPFRERDSSSRGPRVPRPPRKSSDQNPARSKGPRAPRPKATIEVNDKTFPALGSN